MGKQSTGKSYFLNHLTGTSFDIAGARCTDGVWIGTSFINPTTLLIVLDFEGLGSFERRPQEDVFLSVLNAAVSGVTIFRLEMRLDKEIDELFSRFQNAIELIKGDDRLFQGVLIMSVKDVNPSDERDVLQEFEAKLGQLLEQNNERNFLSDMYGNFVRINSSPPLGTAGYYESLSQAEEMVREVIHTTPGFGGQALLAFLRLVLAKLVALDWTSFDDTAQKMQIEKVRDTLPGVLRVGCVLAEDAALADSRLQAHAPTQLVDSDEKTITVTMEDMVDFGAEYVKMATQCPQDLQTVMVRFYSIFMDAWPGHVPSVKAFDTFDNFLLYLVLRRVERTSLWALTALKGDTSAWQKLDKQYCAHFRAMFRRCNFQCQKCRLGCLRSSLHPPTAHHDCGTNHACRGRCDYCEVRNGCVPKCHRVAGHEGHCECEAGDHTCREKCELEGSLNCSGKCEKKGNHEGRHLCAAPHWCGRECFAAKCSKLCRVDAELSHTLHKCHDLQCVEPCVMANCTSICSIVDHFHGEAVVHICGRRHQCPIECEESGICQTEVNHRVTDKKFKGARGEFSYTLQEMNGHRKQCARTIPVGETTHDGPHSCIGAADRGSIVHSCDERCPCCQYYCSKAFGHRGLHGGSHGNMQNTIILADVLDVDVQDRKYRAGEEGVAEMCNLFCSKMGRSHVHFLECEQGSLDDCVYAGTPEDPRRHCTNKLKPAPAVDMDELLHDHFWKTVGWDDPCPSAADRLLFGQCAFRCHVPHDEPSYCVLKAWHTPVRPPVAGVSDGFSYVNKHKFRCVHGAKTGYFHHVFVLDCSGSMSGDPWASLLSGVNKYIRNRIANGDVNDVVSIVTFDYRAEIVAEQKAILLAVDLDIPFRGRRTRYKSGLQSADEVLSRTDFDEFKPVVVFFSDGRPSDLEEAQQKAAELRQSYDAYQLRAFVVGFGHVRNHVLELLAADLGGTYHHAQFGNEIESRLFDISASLSTRAGLGLK
ncbi:TPA: hypothetical protein N0F65_003519 [Lagenidium giganteum]|uniref:VWFA domain-containing protein n=1 Tax=Lagenidium giganteum TaxID=4803 RepID=A0AAV2Z2Z2_9STRA|nr:TPA: hypothetical protein N0F65_003519 [Lagenidium giganteum]